MKKVIAFPTQVKSQAMKDLEWLTEFLIAGGHEDMAKDLNEDFAEFRKSLKDGVKKEIEAA